MYSFMFIVTIKQEFISCGVVTMLVFDVLQIRKSLVLSKVAHRTIIVVTVEGKNLKNLVFHLKLQFLVRRIDF